MYINTINNHTIKYESQSLVVGEGVAYKRILNLLVLAKITGNLFADLRRSAIDESRTTGIK